MNHRNRIRVDRRVLTGRRTATVALPRAPSGRAGGGLSPGGCTTG
ncbi:MAG: hypothetical protein ACR2LZ_10305 [Pyrinomonadaceae bacterium]